MKTPKLSVIMSVFVALFVAVSPVLAAGVTPYEPSGTGTLCAGTGPLVFESVLPGNEWECKVEGTYSVIQPWHSPGGPYNPNLRVDGLSWKGALAQFDSKGLNSGSIWFVPAKLVDNSGAPAAAPANPQPSDNGSAATTPATGLNGWLQNNLVFVIGLLLLLTLAAGIGGALLGRRNPPA